MGVFMPQFSFLKCIDSEYVLEEKEIWINLCQIEYFYIEEKTTKIKFFNGIVKYIKGNLMELIKHD